jgi:pyruvate,water dikinase
MGSGNGFPSNVATVSDAVDAILAREDWNNLQKSRQIRQLWGRITIPQPIAEEVAAAYDRLSRDLAESSSPEGDDKEPFVAIRSSGREEDTENFTRAGEFETFLYIRGREQLLEYLKRAWSGLWTERAIHNRAVLGTQLDRVVGGIIIQRNAWSRVSGVLQTVNIAEDKLREMVINVGLGLGEGIVSGTVAADQIVVAKADNLQSAPLRFRYITSDKREQVVFNARAGYGVVRSSTLYHQRLRPALEYVELAELAAIADRLESAYGHPLDIEFGIEGAKLWILQARPVGTFPALLRETTQQYPFSSLLTRDEGESSKAGTGAR